MCTHTLYFCVFLFLDTLCDLLFGALVPNGVHVLELAIHTHSHLAGSSARCYTTLEELLSIGQGCTKKTAIKG
jgi:hypothetical protein